MPKNVKETVETTDLNEFTGSDHQNVTADPHVGGSASRSADKSGGEVEIPDFATKAEVVNQIIGTIHTMNKDQLADLFKGLTSPEGKAGRAADKHDGEKSPIYLSPTSVKPSHDGNIGYGNPTKSSVTHPGPESSASKMRLSPTAVVAKEDMDVIFGEDLSEELKDKAKIVFEATINSRLMQELVRLEEENEEFLNEAVDEIRAELNEGVNDYLTFVAEEWVKENAVAVDTAIKSEMADTFLQALKDLFENNYIKVSETELDIVAEMNSRLEEMESKFNELVSENIELRNEVTELTVKEAFAEATVGLNEFQIDKLATLSEGIAYDDASDFVNKLGVIKETYFAAKPAKGRDLLSEDNAYEGEDVTTKNVGGPMKAYIEAAERLSKNQI